MRKVIFFFFLCLPLIFVFGQSSKSILLDSIDVLSSTLHSEDGHLVYSKNEFDILNSPYTNVGEILEAFPSLEIRSRSLNDVQADISLRGSTFDQVLILVNGIPFSDPQTGHHNMNLPLPAGSVESIHIMPSGGSYRYGPFAFAGVIDIITKKGRDQGGYASASIGEYGFQNGAAGVSLGKIMGFYSRIDLEYKAADGAYKNRDFAQWQAFISAEREIKRLGKIILNAGYLAKNFGAFNFYSFNFPDQFESIQSLSANAKMYMEMGTIKAYVRQHKDHFELFREELGYHGRFNNGQFYRISDSTLVGVAPSGDIWYQEHNNHKSNTYGVDFESREKKLRIGSLNASYKYGLDFRRDEIISNILGTDLVNPVLADQRAYYLKGDDRNNSGVFAQFQFGKLNSAVRLNANDNFGIDWLPNLDYSHTLNSNSIIKASINRSFRLPSFTDLYYTLGGAQGSENLRPEHAWNSEVSITKSFKNKKIIFPKSLVITGYHRYGQNLIDWIYRTVNNEEVLQADNLTQVSIFGAEINTKGNLNKKIFYSLNAQIASHRAGDINGQSIYVLDYLANRIQAEMHSKSFNGYKIGLVATRQERAGSYISSVDEKIKYPAFSTLDMQLSYDNEGLCIFMNAQNLFNSEIYDRGNVPLPGRWAKLGIRFHW
jgi:iron complex outermembrane receptor protein